MKFIYVIVLFSSMLFAMQKQIILGSYSVQKNALNAVEVLKKQIGNDENLKRLIDENSAEVMSTEISGYTVVSVNIFDSYTKLLPVMKMFKTYYEDAFVLHYPTNGFLEKESMAEVKVKAEEEVMLEESMLEEQIVEQNVEEEQALEEEEQKVEEEFNTSFTEEQRLQELEKETMILEEVEASRSEKTQSVQEAEDKVSGLGITNYYLLGGVALLILIIGGFIIYHKTLKEDENN